MGQSRDKEREQGRGSGSDGVVSGGAGEEYIPEKVEDMALFGVLPCLSVGLVMYFVPIVVFMVFARFNGKIIAKNLKSGYDCEWKEDSWVPAYYALAVLTMLWSVAIMVEAQVYVISGTIAS
ncbi:hypothetical protein glysoja_021316 [Glycine soja]|nr:hypothetical protein glysoja_021316 [Glycine soja]